MQPKFIDEICNACWGRCSTSSGKMCPRCEGSGYEPDFKVDWLAIGITLLIVVGTVYAIYHI